MGQWNWKRRNQIRNREITVFSFRPIKSAKDWIKATFYHTFFVIESINNFGIEQWIKYIGYSGFAKRLFAFSLQISKSRFRAYSSVDSFIYHRLIDEITHLNLDTSHLCMNPILSNDDLIGYSQFELIVAISWNSLNNY